MYRSTPYPAATTAAAMATLPHGAGRPRNLSGSARRVNRVKGSTDASGQEEEREARRKAPSQATTGYNSDKSHSAGQTSPCSLPPTTRMPARHGGIQKLP